MAAECFLQHFCSSRAFGDPSSYAAVEGDVQELVRRVSEGSRGLFRQPALAVGSYSQGLQVQCGSGVGSSDIDFLIPLNYEPTFRLRGSIGPGQPRACDNSLPTDIYWLPVSRCGTKLLLQLPKAKTCVRHTPYHKRAPPLRTSSATHNRKKSIKDRRLDPVCVLTKFYDYMQKALSGDEITLRDLKEQCPAVQLSVRMHEDERVSVDLVPAIYGKMVVSEDWIRHDMAQLSDWWDKEPGNLKRFLEKMKQVRCVGPEVVAKSRSWRFSFAKVETALLQDISCDGGQRREALRLLKFINNKCWVPEYGKLLTSYHLKTVLLWALEIHPVEKWKTLESSLRNLVSVLRHCVKKGNLPHYFLRGFNLFNKRYKEGNGAFERLALKVLAKELALMERDRVQYVSLRFPTKISESTEAFRRAAARLQRFKRRHRKVLKDLKRLEDDQVYELEEEQPGDKNGSTWLCRGSEWV